MNLEKAKNLAIELLNEHESNDWKFRFNSRKSANGVCSHTKKTIYLSTVLTEVRDESNVKNTILHEIAHAIAGQGHGHNDYWRNIALSIGCNAERCSNDSVLIKARYTAECGGCGHIHIAHRKLKRTSWCKCRGRKFIEEEKLEFIQNY